MDKKTAKNELIITAVLFGICLFPPITEWLLKSSDYNIFESIIFGIVISGTYCGWKIVMRGWQKILQIIYPDDPDFIFWAAVFAPVTFIIKLLVLLLKICLAFVISPIAFIYNIFDCVRILKKSEPPFLEP